MNTYTAPVSPYKQILIDAALDQIKEDVARGDLTAIEELLKYCPEIILRGYLPEIIPNK